MLTVMCAVLKKQQQSTKGGRRRRLSLHVPVPASLNLTVSTDIPIADPETREEVLMGGSCSPAGVVSLL